MKLMALIRKREDQERRFQAGIHGVSMADDEGRFAGIRQGAMARAKARRRGEHV